MAWSCSSTSNAGLISALSSASLLTTPRVIAAFNAVDRAHFTPNPRRAYDDSPQTIGYGATISAPHMHAMAVEELRDFLLPGANVLDIGCGSGYLLAIFQKLVASDTNSSSSGYVLGIDHLSALTSLSHQNLLKSYPPSSVILSTSSSPTFPKPSIEILTSDGRQGSPPSYTPSEGWDAIHVGAAAPTMPQALVDQLKRGGRMFIPVGPDGGHQVVWKVDKDVDGVVTKKSLGGVRYVPLTDAKSQHPS